MVKILIAAGGTGGHLFPAQQLVEKMCDRSEKEYSSGVDVMFAGYKLKDNPFLMKENLPYTEIAASAFSRKNLFSFIAASWRGFWQSVKLLRSFRPDVVVGFGSYHVFPVLLASMILRKKIVLFEANCILGRVNRFFAPFASAVALQFTERPLQKREVLVSHFPWGKASEPTPKEKARFFYGLDPHHPTVLVFGGSQGATFFNNTMPEALCYLAAHMPIQVIHFTGKGEVKYPKLRSSVKAFETKMQWAYTAADVVVCRSGAATLGELIAYQKRALLIPFPNATDQHQLANAQFFVKQRKGALLLEQHEATPARIAEKLQILLQEAYHGKPLESSLSEGRAIDLSALILDMGRKTR